MPSPPLSSSTGSTASLSGGVVYSRHYWCGSNAQPSENKQSFLGFPIASATSLRQEPRLSVDLDHPQVHSVETVGGHCGRVGGLGQTLPLAEQFL